MRVVEEPRLISTEYEVLDERFGVVEGDRFLECLYQGCGWAEGPVWVPAGRYLLWSDVPNDRILRWDETNGGVGIFREPSRNANGNALDREGRLVTCEQGARRITRTEHDGSITVLADRFDGHRLNSPNDVVVRSDGSVWFTDPSYGILSNYEGERSSSEIGSRNVYRIDPRTGDCRAVAEDLEQPNGLAFSPDEQTLYVVDSSERKHIRAFAVEEDGALKGGDVFAECTAGIFDGVRVDEDGRLWAGTAEGLNCYDPDATLLGKIRVPETVSNVAFGGARRNQLFLAATSSVYRIRLGVRGVDLARRGG